MYKYCNHFWDPVFCGMKLIKGCSHSSLSYFRRLKCSAAYLPEVAHPLVPDSLKGASWDKSSQVKSLSQLYKLSGSVLSSPDLS